MQQINRLRRSPVQYLIGAFLFFYIHLSAQETKPVITWGVEAGPSISFSGINSYLAATAQLGNHELFIGPKWVLSDSYLISRGPWGLDIGYRWNMVRQKRRSAFVSVEYQSVYQNTGSSNRKITVHETHLVYGFQWQLGERWKLGNSLGLGGVMEKSRDIISGEVNNLGGFSVLFKIFVGIQLGNKAKRKQR